MQLQIAPPCSLYSVLAKRSLLNTFLEISVCVAQHTWSAHSTAIPWAHTHPALRGKDGANRHPFLLASGNGSPGGHRDPLCHVTNVSSTLNFLIQPKDVQSKSRAWQSVTPSCCFPTCPAPCSHHPQLDKPNSSTAGGHLPVTHSGHFLVTHSVRDNRNAWSMVPKPPRGSGEEKSRYSAPFVPLYYAKCNKLKHSWWQNICSDCVHINKAKNTFFRSHCTQGSKKRNPGIFIFLL